MFKRIIAVMTVGVLAGSLVLFGCSSGGDKGDAGSQGQDAASEPQQAAQEEKANDSKYGVTIDDGVVGEDYQGRPMLVVTYTFTNNSDKAQSFMVAVSDKAFQNGVELERAISTDIDTQSSIKEIKPGATVTVQQAYLLDDQSEVLVECTELISFDDTIIAEKTFAVA